jgi:serine/threonine-protein kinase
MGVVYKARHTRLNRIVALKLLLLGQFSSAGAIRRFQREAQAAAALRHPNIVALHDIGELAGQPYFTMEFVEGRSLAALLREGPLPARRAAEYGRAIADAMSAAHAAGIIHRDLKPSNIILDPFDQPCVTDFGLAKRFEPVGADVRRLTSPSSGSKRGKGEQEQGGTDEVASAPSHPRPSDGRGAGGEGEPPLASESDPSLLTSAPTIDLTLTGQILGSPNYLAPELAAGKVHELRPASDLFSIGAMLYECLTGRPPAAARLPSASRGCLHAADRD